MSKTYYVITFKENGVEHFFATEKVTMYKGYTDDILIASKYEKIKDAKTHITCMKEEDKYGGTNRSDYHIVEYTITATAGNVVL
jgi:hypothetical protein